MNVAEALWVALRDRYLLERELGRGGMATVYLARDLKHDRLIALKVLHPELAATLGPDRFQREIRLAARLQHPHIVTVHDSGEAAGQLWGSTADTERNGGKPWERCASAEGAPVGSASGLRARKSPTPPRPSNTPGWRELRKLQQLLSHTSGI